MDQLAREQEPGLALDRTTARRADALLALITAGTDALQAWATESGDHDLPARVAGSVNAGSGSGMQRGAADSSPVMQDGAADSRPVVQRGDADSGSVVQGGDTDSRPVQRGGADSGPAVQRGDGGSGPVVQSGNVQVIVHFDATTGTARLAGGPEITASTAERLACDARVQVLLDDRDGNRMYLGRARRLATPAQIAALTMRDGERCQFPGCSHTRYLHAHHVRHWWRGGPTDIDNLALVCSFHHQLIHDHGYAIHRLPGRWQFRRPDGTPLPTIAAPLTGRAEALIEANTRARLRIDHTTLTPNWYGDRLDPEPILDALLPRRTPTAA